MKQKRIKIVLFCVLAGVLSSSCIDEDLSGCPFGTGNNTFFEIRYSDPASSVSQVRIGIFDSSGNFVKETDGSAHTVPLSLAPGSYTAVCWGNAFDKTRIDGFAVGNVISRVRVHHPAYAGNLSYAGTETIPANDSLYYGRITFTKLQDQDLAETITVKPAHIKLRVTVAGLSGIQAGTPPQDYPLIRVRNLKAVYDAGMNTLGGDVSYYPRLEAQAVGTATARCDVLRFSNDNPVVIEVEAPGSEDGNTVLHSVGLKEFMEANHIIVTDGQEVRIAMQITFSGERVTVTMQPWGGIPVEVDPQT
ncbi:MAG: FimB/Mfa2 family fimbrial subunit [Tannerellaceae bacterium]|jgi:hypothetical protein|nr:FimB/Mfa2 family fimbrial subunit [Tannerellaceae bacterium]